MKKEDIILKSYIEIIKLWFELDVEEEVYLSANINYISDYRDKNGKTILLLSIKNSINEIKQDLINFLINYKFDLALVGYIDDGGLLQSISTVCCNDGKHRVTTLPTELDYMFETFFYNKVKCGASVSVASINRIFNREALIIDYCDAIIKIANRTRVLFKNKLNDKELIEVVQQYVIKGSIKNFCMHKYTESHIFNECSDKKFTKVAEYEKIADYIECVLSRYTYMQVENTYEMLYIAVTPDILADITQTIIERTTRKTNGVYYSPKIIVDFLCRDTIVSYLGDKYDLIFSHYMNNGDIKNLDNLTKEELTCHISWLEDKLYNIKVAEPSVGCGEFLVGMYNIIIKINDGLTLLKREYNIESKYTNYEFKLNIITNALYGVDIESSAIAVTKFRLYMKLYQPNKTRIKDRDIELSIKKGNALHKSSTGFEWRESFSWIFTEHGGFDIVIGNPPYVGEKGNKDIFRSICMHDFGKQYYQAKMDLFYFFFHKGIDIAKENGIIGFITTNYYVTATGGYKLRQDIKARTTPLKLINFNDIKIFNSAQGQHNLITILKKHVNNEAKTEVYDCRANGSISNSRLHDILYKKDSESRYYKAYTKDLIDKYNGHIRITESHDEVLRDILNKMSSYPRLSEFFNVNQGIVSGADKLTNNHINKYDIEGSKGEGIFVVTVDEISRIHPNLLEYEVLKPFYKNSDIRRYKAATDTNKRVIYIEKGVKCIESLFPNIDRHLSRFYPILSQRREAQKGYINYYHLQWSRNKDIFTSEKIIAPQRSYTNTFAYDDSSWFASADVYYITKKDRSKDLKYLTALMNSKLYYIWLYHRGKRKGKILELYQKPLMEVPYAHSTMHQKLLTDAINEILNTSSKCVISELENRINNYVYDIYDLNNQQRERINTILSK